MAIKYKMTTEVPEAITLPDRFDSSIGRLEFFDGFPSKETVAKAYDFLDLQRGVSVFLDEMRAVSSLALREGLRELGVTQANQVAVFENSDGFKGIVANSQLRNSLCIHVSRPQNRWPNSY